MVNLIQKNWRYLLISPLFLTALFTAYIKRCEMSFLNKEVILFYLLLLVIGVIPGFLMVFCGRVLRAITITSILTLFILSQISHIPDLPYYFSYLLILLMACIVFVVVFYGLSKHLELDKLLVLFFVVIWIGAFFVSAVPFISKQRFSHLAVQNKNLAPYIEIVLDGHIGTDGVIPLDDENNIADMLSDQYIHHGFRVYGRAYSREHSTVASFASFLNFRPLEQLQQYVVQKKSADLDYNVIIKNTLFDALARKGYLINVLQSNYLKLCESTDKVSLNFCATYKLDGLNQSWFFVNTREKLISLFSSFIYQFHITGLIIKFTDRAFGTRLKLSKNAMEPAFSALASFRVFSEVTKFAKNIKTGNAYFIHLLLPHSPYVFDKTCHYSYERLDVSVAYFNQVQCVHFLLDKFLQALSTNPDARGSTLVIHGDHGSRIHPLHSNLRSDWTADRMINNHSTFFVVRSPLYKPGYDQTQLPLDYLLKNIVLDEAISSTQTRKPFVNVRAVDGSLGFIKRIPMPLFAKGKNIINLTP